MTMVLISPLILSGNDCCSALFQKFNSDLDPPPIQLPFSLASGRGNDGGTPPHLSGGAVQPHAQSSVISHTP
jgi:hypothetical protein